MDVLRDVPFQCADPFALVALRVRVIDLEHLDVLIRVPKRKAVRTRAADHILHLAGLREFEQTTFREPQPCQRDRGKIFVDEPPQIVACGERIALHDLGFDALIALPSHQIEGQIVIKDLLPRRIGMPSPRKCAELGSITLLILYHAQIE